MYYGVYTSLHECEQIHPTLAACKFPPQATFPTLIESGQARVSMGINGVGGWGEGGYH